MLEKPRGVICLTTLNTIDIFIEDSSAFIQYGGILFSFEAIFEKQLSEIIERII